MLIMRSTRLLSSRATPLLEDLLLVAPKSLADISRAAGAELKPVLELALAPDDFVAQAHRPAVAALWLLPSSAEMRISLRKLTSRSQWRHSLLPGECLVFGPKAREEWTLALPPVPFTEGKTERRFHVLVEASCEVESWGELMCAEKALFRGHTGHRYT